MSHCVVVAKHSIFSPIVSTESFPFDVSRDDGIQSKQSRRVASRQSSPRDCHNENKTTKRTNSKEGDLPRSAIYLNYTFAGHSCLLARSSVLSGATCVFLSAVRASAEHNRAFSRDDRHTNVPRRHMLRTGRKAISHWRRPPGAGPRRRRAANRSPDSAIRGRAGARRSG